MSPTERAEAAIELQRRAAEAIPAERREEFWRLLAEADRLIEAGWQARKAAWALRNAPNEVKS